MDELTVERCEVTIQKIGTEKLQWQSKRKHLFIFSNAGKPIFSRYGDEADICDMFAVMQVLISCVLQHNDSLQRVVAGKVQFVFLLLDPLYYCMVSQTCETYGSICKQLHLIHDQILFHLTSCITTIYQKQPSYDLRQLLGNTSHAFQNLIHNLNNNPAYFLESVPCLPLESRHRVMIGNILRENQREKQLYAILIADSFLVQIVSPKKRLLLATDLLLLISYVTSNKCLRRSGTFASICLPHLSAEHLLHSYVDFISSVSTLNGECGVCLVLISSSNEPERLTELVRCKESIVKGLKHHGCLDAISLQLQVPLYTPQEIPVKGLQHMMYKTSFDQMTSSSFGPPHSLSSKQQKRLLRLYITAREQGTRCNPKESFCCYATLYYTVVVWTTRDFEFFATFSPLASYHANSGLWQPVIECLKWVKKNEDNLFILKNVCWKS